jgi:hypothetical protein
LPSGRRSSEKSIPTVCSNPQSELDVRRTPEPPTSHASPICLPGREQRDQPIYAADRRLDPDDASYLIR